jgi:acyl-CoA thioesterase-2
MAEDVLVEEQSNALLDVLDLTTIDDDIFRDVPKADVGRRLYGGQVMAQALVAAERTTGEDRTAHSLHAYFLRPGDSGVPVVFRVDHLQDGRTFCRRRVTAIQHGEPILCLEASFTTDDSATTHQVTPPERPSPAVSRPLRRLIPGDGFKPWDAFELRNAVVDDGVEAEDTWPLLHDLWFRLIRDDLEGRVSPAAVLTYISDLTLASAIIAPTGRADITGVTSLDHVIYFHNRIRFDDWLLYTKTSPAVGPLRGLAQGQVFARDNTLIATVSQEALLHSRK